MMHSNFQMEGIPAEGMKKAHGSGQADPLCSYLMDRSLRLDDTQKSLIEATVNLGASSIMLGSADELQFLANLCRSVGARKTLDIGTYTGYSALVIAQALPADGKVVTCDVTDEHLALAKSHWERAGVAHKIDFKLGPAMKILNGLLQTEAGTFDFSFIDADKLGYKDYYEASLSLLRPGGVIAIDNTLWGGTVVDESATDETVKSMQALNDFLKLDQRIHISFLNVGDGCTLCFKK